LTPAPLPGWHGKLPALGDFVSRRLDATYLEPWDRWLSEGMLTLREQLGAAWLDAYLASPSWRFLLMPGVLAGSPGDLAWAGVLMPSVDKVGRYFPFTIVQPLDGGRISTDQMPALWQWLEQMEILAADALHDDWDVEHLETELARHAGPDVQTEATPVAVRDPAASIAQEADALWRHQSAGVAYWYAHAQQSAPRWLRTQGLPGGAAMTALFAGADR
jgi:type VI secretion system protein ImpM